MAFPDLKEKRNYLNQSNLNKARIDKFVLVLTLPPALRNIDKKYVAATPSGVVSERLELSVWGIVVPTIEVGKVDVPFGGQVPKVTSFTRPAYEPVAVNFNIDSEFYNWYVIWQWLSLLNDSSTSVFDKNNISQIKNVDGTLKKPGRAEFIQAYTTNINVLALNEYNQIVGDFVYTQAFPTALQGIQFNYKDSNEIVSGFTFEFNQLFFNINT